MAEEIRYTSAPEVYDDYGTRTLEWLPYQSRGRHRYRKVAIPVENLEWQIMRYASGLHSRCTQLQFDEWVKFGLVEPLHTPELT